MLSILEVIGCSFLILVVLLFIVFVEDNIFIMLFF